MQGNKGTEILVLRKGESDYAQARKKLNEGGKNVDLFKSLWRVHKPTIQKSARPPLRNITNLKKKPFLEDSLSDAPKFAQEVIGFLNRQSEDLLFFRCFDDKDLKIPAEFASKTIAHTLDNDVTTDEEQVRSAIRNLRCSIRETIEKKRSSSKASETARKPTKALNIR